MVTAVEQLANDAVHRFLLALDQPVLLPMLMWWNAQYVPSDPIWDIEHARQRILRDTGYVPMWHPNCRCEVG